MAIRIPVAPAVIWEGIKGERIATAVSPPRNDGGGRGSARRDTLPGCPGDLAIRQIAIVREDNQKDFFRKRKMTTSADQCH